MRWPRVAVVAFAVTLPAQAPDTFTMRVWRFETKWDKFVRQYFGCPPTGDTTPSTCDIHRSVFDARAFKAAAHEADELFRRKDRYADPSAK